MTISQLTLEPRDGEPVRRFEVFMGAGRRQDGADEDKARIVAESYEDGVTASAVPRRYALSPQQLLTWRRTARQARNPEEASLPSFVPAVVARAEPDAKPRLRGRRRTSDRGAGMIELEIDGVTVRVCRGEDAKTVSAVIRALKVTS
ncbi:MAG: transposase [Rhizobiales bacterium]|nr:transposase [Hyphomicrobiales bacterium]